MTAMCFPVLVSNTQSTGIETKCFSHILRTRMKHTIYLQWIILFFFKWSIPVVLCMINIRGIKL